MSDDDLTPKTLATQNVRSLLTQIGVGDFNATMIIPYMFIPPATTDSSSAQIIMLIAHLQQAMGLPITGKIDRATANAFTKLLGKEWARVAWYEIAQHVVADLTGWTAQTPSRGRGNANPLSRDAGLGDMPQMPMLPSVPGGAITYLALGGLAYYLWKKG